MAADNLEKPSTSVRCKNCDRLYGPGDDIRFHQYSCTSVLGLRALFAGQLETVNCPACGFTIDFEPGVFVVGIDPPVGYISGGDGLNDDDVLRLVQGIEQEAEAEHQHVDIRRFSKQIDLRVALLERLRSVAGAMTPLNAAIAKQQLNEFLTVEWRSITPEVLVASDVVTMVQQIGSSESAAAFEKAQAYFEGHAEALGRLQRLTWLCMCDDHGRRAVTASEFQHDLTKFVDRGILFNGAVADFEKGIEQYASDPKHRPLILYCMLAVLARARKLRGEPNALEADWTMVWMNVELSRVEGHDKGSGSALDSLALSPDLVEGTLRLKTLFDLFGNVIKPYLNGQDPAQTRRMITVLQQIGERAGFPRLAGELFERGVVTRIEGVTTAEHAMDLFDELLRLPRKNLSLEMAIDLVCENMIVAHDRAGVQRVFQHALEHVKDDRTRADLESWYGATLLRLHQEQLFLEQVGAEEREWEASLPDTVKGRLWTERANALRATGRFKETLAWRKRVVPLYAAESGSSNQRQSIRALATAERETGAPDRALELILPLLADKEALDRINMLDTSAAIWVALGERAKARAAVQEAVQLAVGPYADRRQHFETTLASFVEDAADTESVLLASSRDGWKMPSTVLQECIAWLNLEIDGHQFSDAGVKRFSEAVAALGATLDSHAMPPSLRESSYIVLARVGECYGLADVADAWAAAADAADALGRVPHPEVVASLADHAYRTGDVADGRAILKSLPAALARDVQQLERIDIALNALTNLGGRLDALTTYLLSRGFFHDARTVAEYRRDPLRKAIANRDVSQDAIDFLAGKLFTPVVADTSTVVLEFLPVEGGVAPVLTWQASGETRPRTQAIDPLDLDIFELRDRIVYKLQSWVRGRPGDPFTVKGWSEFCAWLRQSISAVMPDQGHLVVIEAEGLEGMPFHAAVAPDWSCSYASSWISLAAAVTRGVKPAMKLGFAMVPAFADHPDVAASMGRAGRSLKEVADHTGLAFEAVEGTACDEKALSGLLASSDISFVACHGFLDEERNEVSWVLAHKGGLPGKTGALVDKGANRPNHFSWREMEKLTATPQTVLSAACSSGRALVAGLGDRIGLYQSLASRGTRTLIAPAWDIEADLVLPIAARALQLHLEQHMTVATAVRAACTAASKDLPAWCAWALTIEGAWQ